MVKKELEFTPLLLIEEAARCLLCHDAPCSKACPAGTDPARFIRAVRFRNLKGAAEIMRENNALAGICARICPTEKLCKSACSRCGIDKPIEIGKIQQYITDYEQSTNMKILEAGKPNGFKVAIVGSGPCGLEAAAKLRQLGYEVEVFEAREKLGGWLTYGIPEYRLPLQVVENEINKIKEIGVKFNTGTKVDKKLLDNLTEKFDAVLLATGLSKGRNLDLFKDHNNTCLAVDFLAKAKTGKVKVNKDETHLIIGGGDVAMDVASSLKHMGAKKVYCVARESMDEFLASPKELEHARDLEISIFDGYTPSLVTKDSVTFDSLRIESKLTIKAENVYLAVGQMADVNDLGVDIEKGLIETHNFKTSKEKVFAAGDVIKGDKIAVFAVKLGHEAAMEINDYLMGGKKNA